MDRRTIITKTGKGLMEATGKTSNLSRDLRNILKDIDGQVSVSSLLRKLDDLTEPKLLEALARLEREGYVREFLGSQDDSPPSRPAYAQGPASKGGGGADLDFSDLAAKVPSKPSESAKLHTQAQDIARQAQATRAREEAAARAKAEAEARARAGAQPLSGAAALDKARREAEERARRDAEERARRVEAERIRLEAEEGARKENEDRAKREIVERIRREDEEKARRAAEEAARRQAEERARRELEERLRREAEEKARRDAEERARRDAEDRARREVDARAKMELELRARLEAEDRARRETEDRAKYEKDERARREEDMRRRLALDENRRREEQERREREELERSFREQEEGARREQEARARREAEEKARQEERIRKEWEERERIEAERKAAEEAAQQAQEEEPAKEEEAILEEETAEEDAKARAEEEAKARAKAEAKAAKQARKEARAREKAEEKERKRAETARKRDSGKAAIAPKAAWAKKKPEGIGKMLATGVVVLAVAVAAVLPFVSLDASPYQKSAEAWLGQPVTIGSVSVTYLPPRLKFEKVAIGRDPQVRIAAVRAVPSVGWLFGDRKALKSLELDGLSLPRRFLSALLSGRGRHGSVQVERITAKGVKLDVADLPLPALDVDARLAEDGTVQSMTLSGGEHKLSIALEPKDGKADIEVSADEFALPIGGDLVLGDFSAKGTITASELVLAKMDGAAFGGHVFGHARVRWSDGWTLDGDMEARQMDAAKIAAPIIAGGTLAGKGTYSMRALVPDRLFMNARMEGNFTIDKGSIHNVDMTRVLQGGSSGGGTTPFSEMSGNVSADPERILLRQIRMAAGLMSAGGQVEMDSEKNLSGRLQLELRAATVQARTTLTVSGTLQDPQFRR